MIDHESIYLKLPIFLQKLAINIEGLRIHRRRYQAPYEDIYKKKENINYSDLKFITNFQNNMLRRRLRTASKYEFWSGQFKKFNLDLNAENAFTELQKLPILTKEEVKKNIDRFEINFRINDGITEAHTSGSTGSGLKFLQTNKNEMHTWATWWRYRSNFNLNRSLKSGYFGGRSVVSLKQKKAPYWRYNYFSKQIMFSCYHLNKRTIADYHKKINDSEISWLHGYPSFITNLSNLIIDENLVKNEDIKLISLGAENFSEFQKNKILTAFPKAKIIEHYGQAEGVANISLCKNNKLHVDEDYSYVEFIKKNQEKNQYSIIGTNFYNDAFPLFRYDTGDIAFIDPTESCSCGSKWRVIKNIDGRDEDNIKLPDGTKVGRLDHVFKDMENINEAQIFQNDLNSVLVKIVKNNKYTKLDETNLIKEFRKRIGNDIKINISYQDNLVRDASGKLRFVVSNI